VVGLLAGGGGLIGAFIFHGYKNPQAFIDFRFLLARNIIPLVLLLVTARLLVLSSNFIVPQFLTQVAGFRPQQVGEILLWVALPQFLIGPCVGVILRYVDARILMTIGMSLILTACLLASRLTSLWSESEFIPSMLMQAIGQTMVLTSLIFYTVRHLNPVLVITFGAVIQTARLMGGELASALVQSFARVSTQIHSNLLGMHVVAGDSSLVERLSGLTHGSLSRFGIGDPLNAARGTALLAGQVRAQAQTLAYSDAFLLAAATAVIGLFLIATLRSPPA
jgi:DHA2 family multidrug resistance protein